MVGFNGGARAATTLVLRAFFVGDGRDSLSLPAGRGWLLRFDRVGDDFVLGFLGDAAELRLGDG